MPMSEKLVITALSTDGRGIARHSDGRVVFVEKALPGEEVSVTQILKKGSIWVGTAGQIEKASPHRTAPFCPHYEKCGGCQLQHMTSLQARKERAGFLFHNFKRLGRFEDETLVLWKALLQVHEADEQGYRKRIRWHARSRGKNLWTLGLLEKGSHDIIPMQSCPLTVASLQKKSHAAAIKVLEKRFPSPQAPNPELEVEVEVTESIEGEIFARIVPSRRGFSEKQKHQPKSNVSQEDPFHPISENGLELKPYPHPELPDFVMSPAGFVQPHKDALKLYGDVLKSEIRKFAVKFGARLPATLRAWDLYCGHGALSFVFFKAFTESSVTLKMVGVEGVARAASAALHNAHRHAHLWNPKGNHSWETQALAVEKFVSQTSEKDFAHVIIADPPRDGLGVSLAKMLAHRKPYEKSPQFFAYVACDSASLSRDLPFFIEAGWQLEALHLFDTFAQTTHFETIAILIREPK
jgi:23S rRNA (uracil1939-C5)-methyltransferase